MSKMVCPKCGHKLKVADGQRFDEKRRTYSVVYQVTCFHCGNVGPLSGTWEGALDAWDKANVGATKPLNAYGG